MTETLNAMCFCRLPSQKKKVFCLLAFKAQGQFLLMFKWKPAGQASCKLSIQHRGIEWRREGRRPYHHSKLSRRSPTWWAISYIAEMEALEKEWGSRNNRREARSINESLFRRFRKKNGNYYPPRNHSEMCIVLKCSVSGMRELLQCFSTCDLNLLGIERPFHVHNSSKIIVLK